MWEARIVSHCKHLNMVAWDWVFMSASLPHPSSWHYHPFPHLLSFVSCLLSPVPSTCTTPHLWVQVLPSFLWCVFWPPWRLFIWYVSCPPTHLLTQWANCFLLKLPAPLFLTVKACKPPTSHPTLLDMSFLATAFYPSHSIPHPGPLWVSLNQVIWVL